MRMYDIIEKKRDGKELDYSELSFFIREYCNGNIPDYQASALLMAIFIKGMNEKETAWLTEVMASSGDMIDLSGIEGIKVDKHSTGGVGDKTTLIVGPIVAACGVPVAKMSGRGLGHTGGTIDKLESIPGFKTSISKEEFITNVKDIGLSIAGQTGNLAPADKKIYALRDVTATVNNISLIASSIMSKKIACGADRIVLDVKTGSGAFMKNLEDSIELAKLMVKIGEQVGRKTAAIITDMDVPLGYAIGNSLEVIEAIETLKGKGPEDLMEVSVELAAKMLELAGKGEIEDLRRKAESVIKDGSALQKLEKMIERQMGDPGVIYDYNRFKKASITYEYKSPQDGFIAGIRTDMLGTASMILGAGRETKDSIIDPSAGIEFFAGKGKKLNKGDLVAVLHTNKEEKLSEALEVLKSSIIMSDSIPEKRPLILEYVD